MINEIIYSKRKFSPGTSRNTTNYKCERISRLILICAVLSKTLYYFREVNLYFYDSDIFTCLRSSDFKN